MAHFRQDQLNILPDQTWKEGMHNFDTLATALYDPCLHADAARFATQLTGHNLANMFLGYRELPEQPEPQLVLSSRRRARALLPGQLPRDIRG